MKLRLWNNIEIILLSIIGIFCLFIPIAEFTGILGGIPFLAKRVTEMTLGAIGIIALYLVRERYSTLKKIENSIVEGQNQILSKIIPDENDTKIVNLIRSLWAERDSGIRRFFDQISINVQQSENNKQLVDFLIKSFDRLNEGDIFESQTKYPWDFTITAINYQGDFLYHPNEKNISTKATHYFPYDEVLKIKNGDLIFVNHGKSEQFQMLFPSWLFRTYRFTKFYIREFEHLKAIVVFESHINILYQFPNPIKIDYAKVRS